MIDSSVANSSGYFKDPVTKEDFSIDTPRVVECKLENGKFTWPMVMTSAGDPVKIVYKYFTAEEKELYKAYRGRPSVGTSVEKKLPKPVEEKQEVVDDDDDDDDDDTKHRYNSQSARSHTTEELIASCDMYLGTSYMDGMPYAIISKKGSRSQWHIPRSLIKDDEMKRLCAGVV